MSRPNTAQLPVQLPQTFSCAASYQWRNGGGYLTIAPGSLVFEFNRVTKFIGSMSKLVHLGDSVTAVRARLLPPGINTGIIVCGEDGAAQVSTWFREQRVHAALMAAGFNIETVVTWVSCGEQLARSQTRARRVEPPKASR